MKFFFLLLLFFFLLGPIIRFAFRFLVMSKVVKEQKKYYERQSPQRKEGEIKVDNTTPNRPQRTSDSDGQYIDYEEVK